jgi:hypothetical protein
MWELKHIDYVAQRSLEQSQFILGITPIPWSPPNIPIKLGI